MLEIPECFGFGCRSIGRLQRYCEGEVASTDKVDELYNQLHLITRRKLCCDGIAALRSSEDVVTVLTCCGSAPEVFWVVHGG